MRKELANLRPEKLLVIKRLDTPPNTYLVAVCKKEKAESWVKVQTNYGWRYVRVEDFKIIDTDAIQKTPNIVLIEKDEAIREIYEAFHIEQKERRKAAYQKKMIEEHKKTQRKKDSFEQKKGIERAYEVATITNQKDMQRKIVKDVGYVPGGWRRTSLTEEKGRGIVNPKPYQGGRFSPK